MTLTACLTGAWLFVLLALERLRTVRSAFVFLLPFYLCLGLACLVKGPAPVAVFVVMPLLVYLAWTRSLKLLLKSGLGWGAPISLMIGMIWFVLLRERGIDNSSFFAVENLDRAIGAKDHIERAPYWFYFEKIGDFFAPWAFILPFVLFWSIRCWKRNGVSHTSPAAKLLLCWFGVGFALIGLSVSKRALYFLPLFPPLALSIAWVWEQALLSHEGEVLWKRKRLRLELSLLLTIVCVAGGVLIWILGMRFPATVGEKVFASSALLVILVLGWLSIARFAQGRRWAGSVCILAMASVLVLAYESLATPMREREADRVAFFRQVKEKIGTHEFITFGESASEAVWYLNRAGRKIRSVRAPALKQYFFDAPGTLMLAPEKRIQKSPELFAALTVLAKIERGSESFILACPKEGVHPEPAVFKSLKDDVKNTSDETEE
jgi:4-amino-4-deoxy-L-arabinose transferase